MQLKNKIFKNSNFIIFLLTITLFSCNQKEKAKENIAVFTLEHIIDLPPAVYESSGALIYDSLLWTFNDNGNAPVLYAILPSTGEIKREITLTDALNTDWEDIAQDASAIYIANTGNNFGDRNDLCIYKIPKIKISTANEQEIAITKIDFYYPDQFDFSRNLHNTAFDCEAITCIGDSILLFTKDWINYQTTLYTLPKTAGSYEAKKISTYESNGLVTGADYNSQLHRIALVGYTDYTPFVFFLDLNNNLDLRNADTIRYSMPNVYGIQFEGAAYDGNKLYFTNEASAVPQSLYLFNFN